ncbi:MAG: ribosome small subunit-dependent GTPase A, partial [Bacteroidales bacterium]|nr:ribosome small subunit-dependent GTPase A [Bacteroidales bacterium]
MALSDLGLTKQQKDHFRNEPAGFSLGRVTQEHRERYVVSDGEREYDAEITGNLRFSAVSREDFPAVGDWVTMKTYDGELAIIHSILPRFSSIIRQDPGKQGEIQVIAANIDYAFLVQAAGRDFNINRLERYLSICNSSGVKPLIVLTKTDLSDSGRISEIMAAIRKRIADVPVFAISNETMVGYEELIKAVKKGKTYCLLGSSGAGKSTMLNRLSGKAVMKTAAISSSTGKGRHITSHRELIIVENGGIVIDNPGMKEVGIADAADGVETTFERILSLAKLCRYKDCTHTSEKGCAVLE